MALRFLNSGYFAGKVGIGTDSPVYQLTLGGNAVGSTQGLRINDPSNAAYGAHFSFSDTPNEVWIGGITNNTYNSAIGIHREATRSVTIDVDNNVGIGTDNPDVRLEVVEASPTNGIVADFVNSTNAGGTTAAIKLSNADSEACDVVLGANRVGANFGSDFFISLSDGVDGSNQERFRITEAGNVGIGTTDPPVYKLDVDGTFGVSDLPFNTDSVSVLVADEITGVELVTNGDFSNGTTDWSFESGWAVSNGGATVSTAGVTSNIKQTLSYVASISAATKFRYRFEITDITAGSLRLFVNKPTFTQIANVSAVGVYEYDVEVSTGSNGIFYLYSTSSGGNTFQGTVTNVSVKEITPVSNQIQKRELGAGAFGPTPVGAYLPLSAGSGEILTGDLAMNNNIGIITKDSSGAFRDILKLNSSNVLEIGSSSLTTDTIFKNSGNVGIGTIDPNRTLHVYGQFALSNADNSGSFLMIPSANTNKIYSREADNITSSTPLSVVMDATEVFHITTDGRVGIRNVAPLEELDVRSTTFSTVAVSTDRNTATENIGSFAFYGQNDAATPGRLLYTRIMSSMPSVTEGAESGDIFFQQINNGTINETIRVLANGDLQLSKGAKISNQENTDIDSAAAEVVAEVAITYTAAFFDFVVKKGTNIRSGTVYACHDGTNVEFTETSTNDLGDTSDVTLSVDISGANMRLVATVTSDDWSVKSLIRAI